MDNKGNDSYFIEAFQGMQRLSPGSHRTNKLMFDQLSKKEDFTLLDVGCGMGQQALRIAQSFPQARIIAIDNHVDYIRQLNQKASELNLGQRLQGMVQSVEEMNFPPEQFDVIWASGSIYLTGFAQGLAQWEDLLAPEGRIICNDICWKKSAPVDHRKGIVEKQYGTLTTGEEKIKVAEDLGYTLRKHHVQGDADWLEGYYYPLERRLLQMAVKYAQEPQAMQVIESLKLEIECYYRYFHLISYEYFVLEKQ